MQGCFHNLPDSALVFDGHNDRHSNRDPRGTHVEHCMKVGGHSAMQEKADLVVWCGNHLTCGLVDIGVTREQVVLNDANNVKLVSTKMIMAPTRGLKVHAQVLDHLEGRHSFGKPFPDP